MDIEWLSSFVIAAEELNLTRAAVRANVSRSSLSRQIRDLEGALRTDLFTRDGPTIALTPAGFALAKRAPDLLDQIEAVLHEVRTIEIWSR